VEVPDAVEGISSGNQGSAAATSQTNPVVQPLHHSSARRALQGLSASEDATQAQQQEDKEGPQLAFYALPAWERASGMGAGRQLLLITGKPKGRRRHMMEGALDVYQRHM
jgi:hypothetical protein